MIVDMGKVLTSIQYGPEFPRWTCLKINCQALAKNQHGSNSNHLEYWISLSRPASTCLARGGSKLSLHVLGRLSGFLVAHKSFDMKMA